SKGLEHRFALVMRVDAAQVGDMQGGRRMVHEALEELDGEVHIELTDHGAGERHVEVQSRAAGKVDDDTRQGFVQRYIGMPIPADAGLVAESLGKSLAKRDADVL